MQSFLCIYPSLYFREIVQRQAPKEAPGVNLHLDNEPAQKTKW
jgi:hypothetical protein